MRTRLILTAAALLLGLTACTTSPTATPAHTASATAAEATPEATPEPSPDDITDLIVGITWDATSETDKKSMCDGIALFGPEWAADQLRDGAGDDSLDWDRAAVLIQAKCAER